MIEIPGLGDPAQRTPPRYPPPQPGGLPRYLSVSQIETYGGCGYKYKLQKIDGIQEVPAWYNIGGTAFHATAEWFERQVFDGVSIGTGDACNYFTQVFHAGIGVMQAKVPDVPESEWRAANKGTENKAWWLETGPKMVTAYVIAHQPGKDGQILDVVSPGIPHGAPALELEFSLDVQGIEVKGYIDQARLYGWTAFSPLRVRIEDLKAGRKPTTTFQLGVYAHAMQRVHGIEAPIIGSYWVARKGERTADLDILKLWPWEAIVYRTHAVERARRAGIFMPVESSFCGSCSVRRECPTVSGRWPAPPVNPFGFS